MSPSSLVRARQWAWAVVGAALLAPRAPAQALDPEEGEARAPVELRAGAIRSDNVRRTSTAEVDGTIWSAGLSLDLKRRGPRLQLEVLGDLDWMEFPKDTFDGELTGYFDGLASFALVPEAFVWSFQETYGQLRADPFAAVTPNNLEDINYFTTGPDVTLLLGGAASVRLSGRYSTTDYGASGLDNDRYRGELALIRQLSSGNLASLNATSERFEFEDASVGGDFDRHEVFARYEARGSRTELGVDLGYTVIDQAQESSDGVLARLSFVRRLSPAVRVGLSAGTQFSDAGDIFRTGLERQGQQDPDAQSGSVLGTGDPFENRFAAVGWHFNRHRTGFGISAQRSEERYENAVSLDRTRTSYGLYFLRRLTPVMTLRASAGRTEQSFEAGFDDEELGAGAALAWAIGRALELRLHYERSDRDSSAAATEFTENRASLFLSWAPLGRR